MKHKYLTNGKVEYNCKSANQTKLTYERVGYFCFLVSLFVKPTPDLPDGLFFKYRFFGYILHTFQILPVTHILSFNFQINVFLKSTVSVGLSFCWSVSRKCNIKPFLKPFTHLFQVQIFMTNSKIVY